MWQGQRYRFEALPMGLTSSPRIFTKVMKPPLAFLRKAGCSIVGYIDNFFLVGKDFHECSSNVKATVDLFMKLGFTLHPEKSVLVPTQELTCLGFIINSHTMTVKLSVKKKDKLKALCLQALESEQLIIRFIATIIGKIVSSLPAVQFGKLHYRDLERNKIQALKK